jgi:hypothetical protein
MKFKSFKGESIMATSPSCFEGTGFVTFRCDCGAEFEDSVYNAISHVATWHCDSERLKDPKYFEGRLATFVSPNLLDFVSNDLDDEE